MYKTPPFEAPPSLPEFLFPRENMGKLSIDRNLENVFNSRDTDRPLRSNYSLN